MMTSVSHSRALAGARAFGTARPRVSSHIVHSSSASVPGVGFGNSKKGFMVQVEVSEDEPEDQAVRRYMKLVMQSRVLEKLRARKVKETKIEAYKRRFRERAEMRKAGIVEPTYEELYSELSSRPFEDFFATRDSEDPEGPYDGMGADDIFGTFSSGNFVDQWGQYSNPASGGYVGGSNLGSSNNWSGGYM